MYDYYITVAIFLTCIYGFLLFSWWWWKLRKASAVFMCVTFMFLSIAIYTGYGILTYHYFFKHSIEIFKEPLFSTVLWKIRSTPLFITVLIIVILMTVRVLKHRKFIDYVHDKRKQEKRRITD